MHDSAPMEAPFIKVRKFFRAQSNENYSLRALAVVSLVYAQLVWILGLLLAC